MRSEGKAGELIDKAMNMLQFEDIVHKGFLKPIEIALKTSKTEMMEQNTLKHDSLASGLKIAVRVSASNQKRVPKDVIAVGETSDKFVDLQQYNQDNMLSLIKKPNGKGIKLAICICMYSETKQMLKSTLAGISQNIANMVAYESIDPDQIGVFVMMDGIEKVDHTLLSFFDQCEKYSNINLGNNIVPSMSIRQLEERAQRSSEDEINEREMQNVNNFLFNTAELEERNSLRFQAILQQYEQVLKEKHKLNQLLEKKTILYEDLTERMKEFFLEEAKKIRKKDYNSSDEEVNQLAPNIILDDYIYDLNKMKPVAAVALQESKRFCERYMMVKEDLAYLSYFRRNVQFSDSMFKCNDDENPEEREIIYQQVSDSSSEEVGNNQLGRPRTVMNLFLCVKYKNAGKLSSHNWFFNGFCKQLKPEYAVIMDVGLKPEGTAIMKMYKYMVDHPNTGGVCGYMSLKMEKTELDQEVKDQEVDFLTGISNYIFNIQRIQQVEYHFAHLLDKNFEAAFGFIHVLPGAFSGYNMKALIKYDEDDDNLLKSYFKSIQEKLMKRKIIYDQITLADVLKRTLLPDIINRYLINIDQDSDEAMLYNENVYLAEDRILCMGIHKKGFDMAFLPDAYSEVDPMKTVHGLLGQRKRWINGSYFGFEKAKKEMNTHENQNGCEFFLNIQIIYLSFMNALAYISPSMFIFTVHLTIKAFCSNVLVKYIDFGGTEQGGTPACDSLAQHFIFTIVSIFDIIHIILLAGIIFFSLHYKNNNYYFKKHLYLTSTILGIFMVLVMTSFFVDIFRGFFDSSYQYNNLFVYTNKCSSPQDRVVDLPFPVLMRWMLVGSIGIYIFPILGYCIFFWKSRPLFEIIFGFASFLYFTPTYLNILNIYSLCKIDDISWGTKGIDSDSKHSSDILDSWRLLKYMHVSKYVFWNIVATAAFISLGQATTTRFWATFFLVIVIVLSVGIKAIVGFFYMVSYKCRCSSPTNKEPKPTSRSSIKETIKKYEPLIKREVLNILQGIKENYMKSYNHTSFIQMNRTEEVRRKDLQKYQALQKQKSSVQKSVPRRFNQKKQSINSKKKDINETSFTHNSLARICENMESEVIHSKKIQVSNKEESEAIVFKRPSVSKQKYRKKDLL